MGDYLERVENILDTKSTNELKALLLKLAAGTPDEARRDFLVFLENRRVTISKTAGDAGVAGVGGFDAQAVLNRIRGLLENVLEYEIDAHFYESYEWEQYGRGDRRPDGWYIESDGGFSDDFYRCYTGAVGILEHGLYKEAAAAFAMLLEIIATFDHEHENDDEGAFYFQALIDEDWLEIDMDKLKKLRCYSALMALPQDAFGDCARDTGDSEDSDCAGSVLNEIFRLISGGGSKAEIMFNELLDAGSEPVPNVQAVLKRWVSILYKKPPEIASPYIKEIAVSANAPDIMEKYVNTAGVKAPIAYMDLCDLYAGQCDGRARVIVTATEGLQKTLAAAKRRTGLADLLAAAAKEAGDDGAYRYAITEKFRSHTTLENFISILEYGDREIAEAAIRAQNPYKCDGAPNPDYSLPSQSDIDAYIILFWHGDYEQVFDAIKRNRSENEFGYGVTDSMLPYFIGRLADFNEKAGMIKSLVEDTVGDRIKTDVLYNSLRQNMRSVTPEREREWLDYCVKRVRAQTDTVLSAKNRGRYGTAARMLVAIGEMRACRGEENPFKLLREFLLMYPKHNAFKRAVREAQSVSSRLL